MTSISYGVLIECIVSDELQQNDDYIGRIDKISQRYQKFLENNNNNEETFNNIYELIFDEYGSDNVNQFMNDYAKYIENIDKNHIIEKYHQKCEFDIQNCPFIKRRYYSVDRNQNNQKNQYKMYGKKCQNTKENSKLYTIYGGHYPKHTLTCVQGWTILK